MLNFVYYPISAVLWFWHKVFSFVLDPAAGVTWALSIVFLVFTIRILLVKPMANQLRSSRKMQEFQPKMKELQRKYANDQQKLMMEVRATQKEMGVRPMAACLPMLIQMPIFIGLFHVLRSFNRTGTGTGQLGMTIEETRNTPNYVFSVEEVQSFLDSRLFGAPLSSYISMDPSGYEAFSPAGIAPDFTKMNIIMVVVPLMLGAAVIMHFTARMSLDRNKKRQAANPKPAADDDKAKQMQMQMDMMQRMMLWFMPVLILAGGFLWQVGLALYMFTNNLWTLVQQRLLFAKMDREEEEEREAKLAARRTSAPKPGVKPNNPKKGGSAKASQQSNVAVKDSENKQSESQAKNEGVSANEGQGSAPKPGAKPQNAKKKKKKRKR